MYMIKQKQILKPVLKQKLKLALKPALTQVLMLKLQPVLIPRVMPMPMPMRMRMLKLWVMVMLRLRNEIMYTLSLHKMGVYPLIGLANNSKRNKDLDKTIAYNIPYILLRRDS